MKIEVSQSGIKFGETEVLFGSNNNLSFKTTHDGAHYTVEAWKCSPDLAFNMEVITVLYGCTSESDGKVQAVMCQDSGHIVPMDIESDGAML